LCSLVKVTAESSPSRCQDATDCRSFLMSDRRKKKEEEFSPHTLYSSIAKVAPPKAESRGRITRRGGSPPRWGSPPRSPPAATATKNAPWTSSSGSGSCWRGLHIFFPPCGYRAHIFPALDGSCPEDGGEFIARGLTDGGRGGQARELLLPPRELLVGAPIVLFPRPTPSIRIGSHNPSDVTRATCTRRPRPASRPRPRPRPARPARSDLSGAGLEELMILLPEKTGAPIERR